MFRIGKEDSDVDNYSSGGMEAHIDLETGIVCTMAKDGKGHEYILHPKTGKQIVGYQIPCWGEYKNFALELEKNIRR